MKFETTVDLRYTDLDTYGHVNNAVYATIIEEARVDYLETVLDGVDADVAGLDNGTGIVLANLELSFQRPLRRTEKVTVRVRVPKLGSSSIPFEYEIRDDGAVVATGETTVVTIDRETGESVPIPEDWREAIEDFEES